MTRSIHYQLKWIVSDQLESKRFSFETEAQVQEFKQKIWGDLSDFQIVSLQTDATHVAPKKLCVFDMDSTVINQEVIDEIARLFGFYDQVSAITEAAMQGKLDFAQSLKERCKLFAGMPEARLQEILPKLTLSPGMQAFAQTLRARGIKTAIVSGGFEFVLRHFQQKLPIDEIHAHTLGLDAQGNFTGAVQDPVIDAQKKRALVAQMKAKYGATTEQTIVVGDGANDVEMMKEAGVSVSFCGKPALNEVVNTLVLERNMALLEKLI